jgi:hypothetical protein
MTSEATVEAHGLRTCDWPGCRSRYPLVTGPASPGWRSFGVVRPRAVLCPFHSTGEHLPRFVPLTQAADVLRSGCSCDWIGTLNPRGRAGLLDWQAHVEQVDPWRVVL